MSYIDLQSRIADELSRSDLTTEIQNEIASAILWYQDERFPWTEASTAAFNTINGQRYYTLPANFVAVTDVLSQIGNYTYKLGPRTEQYIDRIDWGDVFWTSYPIVYSLWSNQIRLFPPPQANLPVQVKGTIQLLPLMGAANGNWAASTLYALGATVYDSYNNVQKCTVPGTSGSTAPTWPTASTPTTGIGSASIQPVLGATTTDGTVTWELIGTLANAWTSQGEELIRRRSLKNIYAAIIRDQDMAQIMEKLEMDALARLRRKVAGTIALGHIRQHF